MSDVIPALAHLIAAFQYWAPDEGAPGPALERVMDAIEILNDNPEAKAELRAAVANARQRGAQHIDGVPLVVLRCLLMEEMPHD
ncbi:hypothetical protein M2318_004198 [Metapseudomonas resinovorans]|uniref:hypothetical protein n=1 Tax=Metapseudomonas resinovorans TaxID=53412 RepID=UPI003D1B6441